MDQKKYLLLILFACVLFSCGKMYDNIDQYTGETVYPGRYDTIVGHVGFERVEIDLMKAGRIASKDIRLGKAVKTIIEYDNKEMVIDSLVSWVNITGLELSKLYRFRVYTIDDLGNKSVPQEIALIPYTESDLASLVVQPPQVLTSPASAVLSWPSGLSSILLDYYGLQYAYTDKNGIRREGQRAANPRIFAANLPSGTTVNFDIKYKIIPKTNGTPIIDTVEFAQTLPVVVPTGSSTFAPAEQAILQANNITQFTADAVAQIEKLTFPVHTTTLQDLFYFSNLKEIDLTGGTIFNMTQTTYNANGITDVIGGGAIAPFARRVGDMPTSNAQYLIDLLESGTLTKVKYLSNSMGIDNLLAPYIQSGIVELVEKPEEALVDFRFLLDGLAQTSAWKMILEAPAATPPAGTGLENVIKATLDSKNSSFALSLPKEYEFDVKNYKYLKFRVYGPPKSSVSGSYAVYQKLWPRIMNYMWAYNGESTYGQQYWDLGKDAFSISDANLQTWVDMTLPLAQAVGKHNRVIVMNIGGEPSLTFNPATPIVYYFSNFRFTKN
ncbi:DUF4998 domain-containing protein [Niabella insulamsoli]|uniref:DUF4998 domain-containing protein n=1 Tax=Niabella insulamsoli TaxID=3144874 RepID=UPI0031FD39B5